MMPGCLATNRLMAKRNKRCSICGKLIDSRGLTLHLTKTHGLPPAAAAKLVSKSATLGVSVGEESLTWARDVARAAADLRAVADLGESGEVVKAAVEILSMHLDDLAQRSPVTGGEL